MSTRPTSTPRPSVFELVKLTVVHDDFEPGSAVLETITQGWPHILANLKTLLETGETLPPPSSPVEAGSGA